MEEAKKQRRASSSESLKKYLKEISRLPRVTPDEEKTLGASIQQGDEKALRRLKPGWSQIQQSSDSADVHATSQVTQR